MGLRRSSFAHAALAALFPGFFLYHLLVANGLPPVLGGYSVAAAAAVLPMCLLAYVAGGRSAGWHWLDAVFIGFVVVWAIAIGFGAGKPDTGPVVVSHVGAMIQWLALYGIARSADLTGGGLRTWAVTSWVVMTLAVAATLSVETLIQGVLGVASADDEAVATYQDFGLLYLIIALLCVSQLASPISAAFVLVVSVVVLFLNGARSEFVALLVGAWCLMLLLSRRRAWVLGLSALAVAGLWAMSGPLGDLFPDNRIVDLIETRAEGSAREREDMAQAAWRSVMERPLTGRFGDYAPGEYAHNLLSAWVDLGVVGIAALSLALVLPLLELGARMSRHGPDRAAAAAAVFLLLAILLLLLAKTFTYNLVPFALGLYANAAEAWRRNRTAPAP